MNKNKLLILSLFSLIFSYGCSSVKSDASFPKTQAEQKRDRLGKLGGSDGLFKFGGKSESNDGAVGIAVNSYLWRATLDTLSFMPLKSADPFGGVVITEWYENPDVKGERFKVNVIISSKILRSNAIKVTVFKQTTDSHGQWRDSQISPSVARDLEDKILTEARNLHIQKQ